MPKKPTSGLPETMASPRFIAAMLGLSYSATIAALNRKAIRRGGGGLRDLDEVRQAYPGRSIEGQAYEILRKRMDQHETSNTALIIPKKDYDLIEAAWKQKGVGGSDMLIAGSGKPGRPRKADTEPQKPMTWEMSPLAQERLKLEQKKAAAQEARIQGHREVLRLRRAQSDRMMGLMCDRATVASAGRLAGNIFSQYLRSLPGKVVGRFKQIAQVSDAQLRQIEEMLSEEIPNIVAELEKAMAEGEAQAAAMASSPRYGHKNWTAENAQAA